jgi:hypothetical protein
MEEVKSIEYFHEQIQKQVGSGEKKRMGGWGDGGED